jgi:hydrophobic/amphiphilic exporter-1 (mainly G- bacteria), HAE1 family
MNPSRPFIQHSVMTFIIAITVILLGVLSYSKMPVSDLPNTEFPAILVKVSYPGATPKTMESAVTIPLEKQLMMCEGLQQIASTSQTGSCQIVLQFQLNRSIDFAAQDVLSALNRASGNLPSDLPSPPSFTKVNPTEMPILFMTLTSDTMKASEVYDFTDDIISRRISMVEGVSEVSTYGSPFAVRVRVNPKVLAARSLGYQDIYNVVTSGNTNQPTGAFWGAESSYNIVTDGQLFHGEAYGDLVVRSNDTYGQLKLRDIGTSIDSSNNDRLKISMLKDGKAHETVFLAIQKQPGENTIGVTNAIMKTIESIQREIPPAIDLQPYFSKSEWIIEAVDDVKLTLFVAFILVIFVVYLTLGKFTSTLVPLITLPLSILGTCICMYLLGYSIDILSLFAVTLSVGFLVDDTIIVVENIVRYIESGKSSMDAALEGSKQISLTVISTTLSLIAVFIPMFLMGGFLGRIFKEFAAVICIALLFSAFFSLSIGPLLCSRWIKGKANSENSEGKEAQKKRFNPVERFSEAFSRGLQRIYKPSLEWAFRFKALIVTGGVACFLLTAFMGYVVPKDFFPDDDLGIISGITLFPEKASPDKRIRVQDEINRIIESNPHVDKVGSVSGESGSFPGSVFWPMLKPITERPSGSEVIRELYTALQDIPDIHVAMTNFKLINLDVSTSSSQGDYSYALQSLDSTVLYKTAEKLVQKLSSLPEFTNVSSDMHIDKPQIEIHIDREKASALGVTASALEDSLKLAYADVKSSQISTSTAQYNVIIEVEPIFYESPTRLDAIYVSNTQGQTIPLSSFATWRQSTGPQSIQHINAIPSVTLFFSLSPGVTLGEAIQTLEATANDLLPPGVMGSLEGSAAAFADSNDRLIVVLIGAIFVIYSILAILYESFVHPLTPLSALPAATVGAFLTLFVCREDFTIYAFIGIIMLIGIVMKNGIMLIEFAREKMVKDKKSAYDAMTEAALTRVRPIIMTTISTIMGALPIALGIGGAIAKAHRSLGLVIIGGLVISQIITLYLTPCAFLYLESLREWGLKIRGKIEPSSAQDQK